MQTASGDPAPLPAIEKGIGTALRGPLEGNGENKRDEKLFLSDRPRPSFLSVLKDGSMDNVPKDEGVEGVVVLGVVVGVKNGWLPAVGERREEDGVTRLAFFSVVVNLAGHSPPRSPACASLVGLERGSSSVIHRMEAPDRPLDERVPARGMVDVGSGASDAPPPPRDRSRTPPKAVSCSRKASRTRTPGGAVTWVGVWAVVPLPPANNSIDSSGWRSVVVGGERGKRRMDFGRPSWE